MLLPRGAYSLNTKGVVDDEAPGQYGDPALACRFRSHLNKAWRTPRSHLTTSVQEMMNWSILIF